VLGDRLRRGCRQLASMNDADADVGLADLYVADLLIRQLLSDRLAR